MAAEDDLFEILRSNYMYLPEFNVVRKKYSRRV